MCGDYEKGVQHLVACIEEEVIFVTMMGSSLSQEEVDVKVKVH